MEGALLKLLEILGGLSPLLRTSFRLDNFVLTHFPQEKESTLLSIEEECYNPKLAFSFF